MKIPVDGNMSYARDLFSRLDEATTVPGRPIPVAQSADADALVVRLVTKVNEPLLAEKPTKFVGAAIAGIGHAGEAWLKQAGVGLSAAPGCNVIAIVEYVFSSLLTLAERDGFSLHERTVGIVGASSVGCRLRARPEALGTKTLPCNPPRADRGSEGDFRSLDGLAQHANILAFHASLSEDGPYKTPYLADEELIRSLKPGAVLINAYHGTAVDSTAPLTCLSEGQKLSVVLDVWEGEPELNVELLKRVDIGTPHIAGYILESKVRGTTQVFEAYSKFVGHEQHVALDTSLPAPEFGRIMLYDPLGQLTLKRLVHLVYDVHYDDTPLCKVAGVPGESDKPRKNYLEHHEWPSLYVICDDTSAASLLCKLSSNAIHHPVR